MYRKKLLGTATIIILIISGLFTACQKDYYKDSGLQKGVFSSSCLEYLKQQPFFFDSLVTVIHLAGMDAIYSDSTITFFAPTDHSIAKAMDALNSERYASFQDSLRLQDIPGEVWRKFLARYTYRGKYMLKDIPRLDQTQLNVYPGMNIESWDGYIMNLGVNFSDYNDTKDVGPRQLTITDIGDLASPNNNTSEVATTDLQTRNGIVHVLEDKHEFGFSVNNFVVVADQYIK